MSKLATKSNQQTPERRELQQLLDIISHDLVAPIRHVREFSRLLLASIENKSPDQQDYEKFVEKALGVLDKKLAAITNLSRTSVSSEAARAVQLGPMIELVCAQELAKNGQSEAKLHLQSDMPSVFARQTQLRELLRAVINNASLYHNSANALEINVGAELVDNQIMIQIKDNGIGIDPKHHEHVFELFRQLDPERNPDGVGAGLTLARKMARENGGDALIDAATTTKENGNQGTIVNITLPAAQILR